MEGQGLEQLLEYHHIRYERLGLSDRPGISAEQVIRFKGKRIIYFWSVNQAEECVGVVVPGILIREKHRKDLNGNEYSLVRPVSGELKPNLEVAIWDEFIKKPEAIQLRITRFDSFRFDYWSYSDAAKRSHQRE